MQQVRLFLFGNLPQLEAAINRFLSELPGNNGELIDIKYAYNETFSAMILWKQLEEEKKAKK
jgi:hypothetical protein